MSSADRYTKTRVVTWEHLHHDARLLAMQLVGQSFTGIVAVTRGGLVPAAILARELDIRLIETLCLVSYNTRNQDSSCCALNSVEGDGEGWLVIDDLVDTGKTAEKIREMLPKATLAVLYTKPAGLPWVDLYVEAMSQDTWVLFPWDAARQFVEPLISVRERTG